MLLCWPALTVGPGRSGPRPSWSWLRQLLPFLGRSHGWGVVWQPLPHGDWAGRMGWVWVSHTSPGTSSLAQRGMPCEDRCAGRAWWGGGNWGLSHGGGVWRDEGSPDLFLPIIQPLTPASGHYWKGWEVGCWGHSCAEAGGMECVPRSWAGPVTGSHWCRLHEGRLSVAVQEGKDS